MDNLGPKRGKIQEFDSLVSFTAAGPSTTELYQLASNSTKGLCKINDNGKNQPLVELIS